VSRARTWLGIFASLLLLAGIVLGQEAVAEIYPKVRKASGAVPSAYADATTGGDSKIFTRSTTSATGMQFTGGAPTLMVEPTFSVGGATLECHVGLYWFERGTFSFTNIAYVFTLTAASHIGDSDGRYLASNPLTGVLDILGADAYTIRYVAVSSGNIRPTAHTAGAGGRAAE
jgi:hypothetical protein